MDPTNDNGSGQVDGDSDASNGTSDTQNQSSATDTQVKPTTPSKTQEPEADYKNLYEQAERRRKGLDRIVSQLRSRKSTQTDGFSENLSDDEKLHSEYDKSQVKLAEYQLKEETSKILEDYPDLDPTIKKAIVANPRGFVKTDTMTVDDAILDIQEYITGIADLATKVENTQATSGKQQFNVASPNATLSSSGKPDLSSMSQTQIEAMLDSGQLTMADLENEVRTLAKK